MTTKSLRARLYCQLAPEARRAGLSPLNKVIALLIILASLAAILGTEPTISRPLGRGLGMVEVIFGVLFLAEYMARLWVAPEGAGPGGDWSKRWRFMVSPWAIVDLVAIVVSLAPGAGATLLLRGFRLLRVLRLARLGRLSNAWSYIAESAKARSPELLLSLLAGLILMIGSATLLYLVEGDVQPEKFGSIPRALWWAVATLTTIGYGDVYPITALGKVLAAVTAITSIGLIALPTGILAAAFSDAMARHRSASEELDG